MEDILAKERIMLKKKNKFVLLFAVPFLFVMKKLDVDKEGISFARLTKPTSISVYYNQPITPSLNITSSHTILPLPCNEAY